MKYKIWLLLVVLFPFSALHAAEDWKGKSPEHELTVGALGGLGFTDDGVGFVMLGNVAKKIIDRGFVPDLNDQVFIEAACGPLLIKGTTAFQYSLHVRWDFNKDQEWTFFALGGVGGLITGTTLGSRAPVYLRFGLGAFWHINSLISLRAEGSHESIAAGVSVAF